MMNFTITVQSGIIHVVPTGELTTVLAEKIVLAMLGHPDFQPGMPGLWDLRQADLSRINASALQDMAARNRNFAERRGTSRLGLLVDTDHDYGVARMYEVLGQLPHLEIRGFRDSGEAEAWLTESISRESRAED